MTGPVFFKKSPAVWLGQEGEKRIAVPDALFKIVVRQSAENVRVLPFLIPNFLPKDKDDYLEFLTSVDRLEALTGLDFLSALPDDREEPLEGETPSASEW